MKEQMNPLSMRMPPDLADALRRRAEENDESLSDVLRRAALRELGVCPTCGRPMTPDGSQG